MRYLLQKKPQKMIHYFGKYTHGAGENLQKITNATWKAAVEHGYNAIRKNARIAGRECTLR